MVHMIKAAFSQGGLLSIAEIATIMDRGLTTAQRKLSKYQREKSGILPTRKGWGFRQQFFVNL